MGGKSMNRTRTALAMGALLLAIPAGEAAACSSAPGWTPPPLAEWLAHSPVSLIGTVISSGWPEGKIVVGPPPREVVVGRRPRELDNATCRIALALKAVTTPSFGVRPGAPPCEYEF